MIRHEKVFLNASSLMIPKKRLRYIIPVVFQKAGLYSSMTHKRKPWIVIIAFPHKFNSSTTTKNTSPSPRSRPCSVPSTPARPRPRCLPFSSPAYTSPSSPADRCTDRLHPSLFRSPSCFPFPGCDVRSCLHPSHYRPSSHTGVCPGRGRRDPNPVPVARSL